MDAVNGRTAEVYLLDRLLRGPLGGICLRPASDRLALQAITRWYLPLCKALAVAEAAEGSVERFVAALPRARRTRALAHTLGIVDRRRRAMAAAAAAWEAGFFAQEAPSDETLAALQARRQAAAAALAACRPLFLPLRRRALPVGWQIVAPDSSADRHGLRLDRPGDVFRPDLPDSELRESHRLVTDLGEQSWLRFPSRDDSAWARVLAPRGVARPPTVIYAHPFGNEFDFGAQAWDPLERLVARGIRVIRPEGPWHGRRRLSGCFSGEPVLSRSPFGFADYLTIHVKELALLIAWARRTGGQVALAGTSLGALTSQMLAAVAVDWPAERRPDALLLIAPAASLLDVLNGSLTTALGLPQALAGRGWRDEDLLAWTHLLQPDARSAVPPERTLFVLGECDDVTPYASGLALARSWAVPAANLHQRRQGHFLLGLTLFADDAPLRRLAELIAQPPLEPSRSRSAAR